MKAIYFNPREDCGGKHSLEDFVFNLSLHGQSETGSLLLAQAETQTMSQCIQAGRVKSGAHKQSNKIDCT